VIVHRRLSKSAPGSPITGSLAFDEFDEFHPHITLAQNLTPDQVDELSRVVRVTRGEPGAIL